MKKELIYLKTLQIFVDGLLILAAFVLAYFVRIGFFFSTDFPFNQYLLIAIISTPLALMFMFFIRAYKINQQIWSFRHFQRLTFVALENMFVFTVLYYFSFRILFSRMILVYIFIFTLALTFLWHLLFRWILQKATQKEIGVYRTLVIGSNRPAEAIVKLLIDEKSHIKPVAIINAHGGSQKKLHGVPIVGKMNQFEKAIEEHRIDLILQVDHLEQSINIINHALSNNLKYLMPPELLGVFQGQQILEEIEGMPFLKLYKNKIWWQSIW